MLGKKHAFAEECFKGNYIAAGFLFGIDLIGKLPENWREFNKKFIPAYLKDHPEKSKVTAGLACGALWTVAKGIRKGDLVLCRDGLGRYRVGEVIGDYFYQPDGALPHRRPVNWLNQLIDRSDMSDELKHSTGSIGTVSDISGYRDEIEKLVSGISGPTIVSTDESVESPSEFALEEHLEDFLIENWDETDLGKEYDIYEEDGEKVGQQYQTDTGPLDILAISKDKKRLLVVELKKGRASDAVVGQILRYMSYVQDELAEKGQTVQGAVIAHEEDPKIQRALSMIPDIVFYRYEVSFKLVKA
jgi:restriction system protein